jgi:hypothetical protein
MTPLLLAALLSATPDGGLAPPELVDEHGTITTLDGGTLEPGTVCLTPLKAASVRDDLVASHAQLDVYESNPPINWPLVLGGVAAGLAVGVVAGYGVAKAVK